MNYFYYLKVEYLSLQSLPSNLSVLVCCHAVVATNNSVESRHIQYYHHIVERQSVRRKEPKAGGVTLKFVSESPIPYSRSSLHRCIL